MIKVIQKCKTRHPGSKACSDRCP